GIFGCARAYRIPCGVLVGGYLAAWALTDAPRLILAALLAGSQSRPGQGGRLKTPIDLTGRECTQDRSIKHSDSFAAGKPTALSSEQGRAAARLSSRHLKSPRAGWPRRQLQSCRRAPLRRCHVLRVAEPVLVPNPVL